jgi:ABC-type dipeptide/oligopeptide/nickel transport system permease component
VLRYVARRILLLIPMLLGVLVVVFALLQIVPGDPAVVFLGENATPEAVAALRSSLGLDEPWPLQLERYVGSVLRLDLGRSIFQDEPVIDIIARRLPATLELAIAALVVATLAGTVLGVLAATRRGSWADAFLMLTAQLGVSMPVFWLGILLVALFAVHWNWFPAVGRGEPLVGALGAALSGRPQPLLDALSHLFLPTLALAWNSAAVVSRLVRASLLDTLHEDYVRAARARGIPDHRLVWSHALRNALLPVVSVLGVRFGVLLGGSVLTESIFGWPGLGSLAVTAISQRDLPLVQGIVLVFAAMFLLLNLLVDLSYGVLDPRVRLASGGGSSAE